MVRYGGRELMAVIRRASVVPLTSCSTLRSIGGTGNALISIIPCFVLYLRSVFVTDAVCVHKYRVH